MTRENHVVVFTVTNTTIEGVRRDARRIADEAGGAEYHCEMLGFRFMQGETSELWSPEGVTTTLGRITCEIEARYVPRGDASVDNGGTPPV